MARIELPHSRLKTRKRRRRMVVVAIATSACVALVAAAIGFTYIPFLRITHIEVHGTHSVATSTVQALVAKQLRGRQTLLFAKDNVFTYPNKAITRALTAEYPVFKVVSVYATDFHTLGVEIVEREPVALWCSSGTAGPPAGCSYMDEEGIVYSPAPEGAQAVRVAYQGSATPASGWPKQFLTAEQFHSLSALVGALSQSQPNNPIRTVVVDDHHDIRAYFQQDFVLIFALGDASGDVFDRFVLAQKSEPFKTNALSRFEYLDLRWGDKLYYKLKEE